MYRQEQAKRLLRLLERRRFDPQLGTHRIQYVQEYEEAVVPKLAELYRLV
jgi:hypothetical protein